MSILDPTWVDPSSLFGYGGVDFTSYATADPSQYSATYYLDTATGQVVTGAQAEQLDPTAWQASLQALMRQVNTPLAASQATTLADVLRSGSQQYQAVSQPGLGLSAADVYGDTSANPSTDLTLGQMAALGLMGTSALTSLGGLATTLAKGTPNASQLAAPGMSPQQAALLAAQTGVLNQTSALLGQQAAAGQATLPALLARAGLVQGSNGQITDIYGNAINAATLGNLNLAAQYQGLASKASGTDLTQINPALTQYLNDQAAQFQAGARSQFGPGYQQSTPYQNAQYYQDLARTNALVSNQLQYQQAYQNLANAAFSGSQTSPGTAAGALQTAGGSTAQLGNLSTAFSNPLSSLQSQQYLTAQGNLNQYNANASNAAYTGQALGQFAGGLGQLGVGLSNANALAGIYGSGGGGGLGIPSVGAMLGLG